MARRWDTKKSEAALKNFIDIPTISRDSFRMGLFFLYFFFFLLHLFFKSFSYKSSHHCPHKFWLHHLSSSLKAGKEFFLHKKGSFNVRLRNAMASLPLYFFLLFHVLSAWKHQNQPSSHVKLSKDLKWTRDYKTLDNCFVNWQENND